MNFNPETHLAELHRSVAFLERDGQPASAVGLSRSFATTLENLWDAVTDGDRIPRWFAPVSGNLEPGGHYQVEGNAGGAIVACEPQSHFGLTWEFAGDVSWVEVQVWEEEAGRVGLTLVHTALLSEHWDTIGPGAVGVGWEMASLGLALHIADPSAPKPDEEEFATSSDGRTFITGSSEAWAQAAIAAGTEAEAARAAAGKTAAFYTGEG
ncbi:MAG: SRPBCC domain-containing protein [Chloroflexota bacterium]|nr:SRPBCC domain-containing protein [Chloroflexota bacterium]